MNKIFIDCGAHLGESVELFQQKWTDWAEYQIHSFEAEKSLYTNFDKFLSLPNFTLHKKAVWVEDGMIDFYSDRSREKWGGSINSTKIHTADNPTSIECINLSNWIISNFNKTDLIILKLDIEGSEYDLIDHLISTGAISYINVLYVEYHAHKISIDINPDVYNHQYSAKIKNAANDIILKDNVHTQLKFTK